MVELLIVIAIIGVLSAGILGGIRTVRAKADLAEVQNALTMIENGVQTFFSDKSYYPGWDVKTDEDDLARFNAFPTLFNALHNGKKNYLDGIKYDNVVVEDPDGTRGGVETDVGYELATTGEIEDKDIEKFFLDVWDYPLYYRENKNKKKQDWMLRSGSFDLWSIGPDGINHACEGRDYAREEGADDIYQ